MNCDLCHTVTSYEKERCDPCHMAYTKGYNKAVEEYRVMLKALINTLSR